MVTEPTILRGGAYRSPNRGGRRTPEAVVWHITQGKDSLAWLRNPASQASANYLIARDGRIMELVEPEVAPWTNGPVCEPDTANPLIARWLAAGTWFNQPTITIEHEGFSSENRGGSLTAAQIEATVHLTAWLCARFKIAPDRTHILGHFQIDNCQRHYCPGFSVQEWNEWVGRVAALVKGQPVDQGYPGALQTDGRTVLGLVDFGGQAVSVEAVTVSVRNAAGERYSRRWSGHQLGPWERTG